MPRNNFEGGGSIFPTVIRPSLFNPLPPSELLTRKGEKFIWLRAMPTPDLETGRLALPDENKGYIYTYEKTVNIADESTVVNATNGNIVQTRYSPISRVNRVYLPKDPMLGQSEEYRVKSFSGNTVELESADLKYYDNVVINYDIQIYETVENVIEVTEFQDSIASPYPDRLIVKINSVWELLPGNEKWEEKPSGFMKHTYQKFVLDRKIIPGTQYRISFDIILPLDVAYKTIKIKDIEEGKLPQGTQEGDLEILVSDTARLTKGDILISTLSYSVEKEIANYVPGKGFPLKRNPVIEAFQVISKDREYDRSEYRIEERNFLVLNEKPENMPKKISAAYTYNPAFRVAGSQEYSALSGKQQLRQYVLRPDTTNIILPARTK